MPHVEGVGTTPQASKADDEAEVLDWIRTVDDVL